MVKITLYHSKKYYGRLKGEGVICEYVVDNYLKSHNFYRNSRLLFRSER